MTKIRKDSVTHSLAAVLSVALLASAACSGSSESGTPNATDGGTTSGGSSGGSSAEPSVGTSSAGSAAMIPASGSGGMVGAAGGGGVGGALGGSGGAGAGGMAGKAGTAGMGGTPADPNAGTITCALTSAIGDGEGGAGGAAEAGAGGAASEAAGGSGAAGEPAVVPGPATIGGFTLYNWVTDQKFPGCGPFFDDITITVTGTPPVTAVATLDSDIIQALNPNGGAVEGSVLWDYDEVVNGNSNCASVTSTCFNIEGREPFSLFGDEQEGNFDGPLTKANAPALHSGEQHSLRVRAYTAPLGGGEPLGEIAITITVKR